MRVFLQHRTTYVYGEEAAFGPHIVRLRPATHTRAALHSYNLSVSPECEVRWQFDPWGNRIARLTFPVESKARELTLTVDASLDIRPVNPFDFFVDDRCEELPFAYPDGLGDELAPFLEPPEPTPLLASFVEQVPATGGVIDYLVALNQKVAERVDYIIRDEPGIQTSEETLTIGRGSCRDSARLLVDVLRSRGIAARFVSGYLVQLIDEGIIPELPRGVDRDVLDLHAWAEAYIPGGGWIGLDGTSGLLCGEGHIPLASAVDPEHAAPVSGTASTPAIDFVFEMTVSRVGHEPRPRVPYTDEAWANIRAAGDTVDAALVDAGVQLTCGGEPTWTSREHPRAPEWNTEALGATKWRQGLDMARELSERLGTGTLTMHRMGKQYPGESLPRWILHLLWRTDGVPIWRNRELLAIGNATGNADEQRARDLIDILGGRLGVAPTIQPGYEDAWHFLEEEQKLPADVDPLKSDLDDSEERRRLARVLERGLGRVVGWALPLTRRDDGWASDQWSFRRDHMYLIPGDSPMGLRLPLDRVGGDGPNLYIADKTTGAEPFAFDPRARLRATPGPGDAGIREQRRVAGERLYTALCVEPRDGILHVFLPPICDAEHFLELAAAIEDSAAELGEPVLVEGYAPPPDPRLRACVVAPDPGVIEVNIPVCRSFRDYVSVIETASDAANHAGLTTEKYQLDGREVGSGGGNHLTLGGPTTVESPFLQRPEMLGSLLRYLNNHPSLSYLFTGLFVGPTSQAPRLDEARLDSLYELEIALGQVPEAGAPVYPWLADRLFRHLLVDVAGNGHRTELCIDKLYDPHNLGGRQGIVELRAFEMPPHERMAAVQMLLARSLAARFVRAPYRAPVVRWGSRLHDQFMLPHYLWADFQDVATDLASVGLPIEAEWFEPFLDHRCPVAGRMQIDDVGVELRSALEPWPTLGEQPAGPVVARYVDSSVERVQVKVTGVVDGRHEVAVNGVRVPLRDTGTASEKVAGVRFRAWQPPESLQPTIGVHHPLRFDVIDTWANRSLGACTYHVWHPEGRAYDEPPLTAFEAAARRAQRFTREGHAEFPAVIRDVPNHPEQPFSIDLRRA